MVLVCLLNDPQIDIKAHSAPNILWCGFERFLAAVLAYLLNDPQIDINVHFLAAHMKLPAMKRWQNTRQKETHRKLNTSIRPERSDRSTVTRWFKTLRSAVRPAL